jgi:DNA-binding GntR family transcriptional regulator
MEKAKPTFVKASEQVRAAVEAAIRDGSLPPGEAIDEADWASRHRVSRTPVREALILLQAEGLAGIDGGMRGQTRECKGTCGTACCGGSQ